MKDVLNSTKWTCFIFQPNIPTFYLKNQLLETSHLLFFNRVETGSIRKISLSVRFLAASRKKSFYISVMSHNAEVKLCHLYQFAEAFSGIASCKIFCLSFMFHHFTINCIWLVFFSPAWDTRWGKNFLRGVQIVFWAMTNTFHRGGEKFQGRLSPPRYAPEYECEAGCIWSILDKLG